MNSPQDYGKDLLFYLDSSIFLSKALSTTKTERHLTTSYSRLKPMIQCPQHRLQAPASVLLIPPYDNFNEKHIQTQFASKSGNAVRSVFDSSRQDKNPLWLSKKFPIIYTFQKVGVYLILIPRQN